MYQSDNSPIVYFAPYCTGGAGLPPPFAMCPAGQTCCALVNDFPGQGPCWWTSGLQCAVAQNYVCEYEYEGKYLHYSLQLGKFILSFKNDSVFQNQ